MSNETFGQIRSQLMQVFPPDSDDPRHRYTRRTWIFPNHIDIAVDFGRQLAEKYRADIEVCMLGALLHDAGLAYKRTSAAPDGHEERSGEYAREILPGYGYDAAVINRITECIAATEPEVQPQSLEAKIVRTADAMSHLFSVHYLAKAVFSATWDDAINFVERKVQKDFAKICFDDERMLAQPVFDYYMTIIQQYRTGKISSLAGFRSGAPLQ